MPILTKMKPNERFDWIEKRIPTYHSVDVVTRDFVEDYTDATGASYQLMPFGADKCPQLGRDLAKMADAGRLTRCRVGIDGMGGMGFPRWVWSYSLPKTNNEND